MRLFDLTGRGIGLTGGGGHLGRSLAFGLAEAGAVVVICGRREAPLLEVSQEAQRRNLLGSVVPHVADVAVAEQVEAVLDAVESAAGRVDGWVNNAYSGPAGKLLEVTRAEAESSLSNGFTNCLMATQAAARRMIPHGRGSIVNIASMYGLVSPQPEAYRGSPEFHNPPAYGAAKAALLQFTRYAACHLAPHALRVNAVSPGPFPSPEVQKNSAFVRELNARVPLGRIGRPEELVGAVIFFLADASSFVTGANLVVDGGWTAW